MDDALDFFAGDVADVLFTSAEEGSAYTLMYPRYEVVVPEFEQPPLYLAYPVPKGELDWLALVDNWLVDGEGVGRAAGAVRLLDHRQDGGGEAAAVEHHPRRARVGEVSAAPPRKRKRLSTSTWILIGLGLGVVAGILFGELMKPLGVAGDAYIKFTQITVLPYILLSLIHGVGSLRKDTARRLATRGLPVILMFWTVIISVYLIITSSFPPRTAATFYDPNRFPGAKTESFDWMSYIPANPFASLADGMVPAVVIFSLCVGIALIGVTTRKQSFLNGVDFVNGLLGRVNHATFVYISPIGIFAIMANTVGTLSAESFLGVAVYFATYVASRCPHRGLRPAAADDGLHRGHVPAAVLGVQGAAAAGLQHRQRLHHAAPARCKRPRSCWRPVAPPKTRPRR